MIVDQLINILTWLLSKFISVLPAVESLPDNILNTIYYWFPKWSEWNVYIPVSEMFMILTFIFTIETAIISFKSVDWTYKKFRG